MKGESIWFTEITIPDIFDSEVIKSKIAGSGGLLGAWWRSSRSRCADNRETSRILRRVKGEGSCKQCPTKSGKWAGKYKVKVSIPLNLIFSRASKKTALWIRPEAASRPKSQGIIVEITQFRFKY